MAPLLATLGLLAALSDPAALVDPTPPPSPIYGGQIVTHGDWAEVVAIDLGALQCTGTLIAPNLVLTAAHCFRDAPSPEKVRVIIGDQSVAPIWETNAATYRVHPDYCMECKSDIHDYAYIVLNDDAPVSPAAVLTTQDQWDELMTVGASVLLIGFGEDEKGLSSIKREAETTIRSYSTTHLEFLAGGDGVDSCQGDSGGPAYVRSGGRVLLAGVLSRGYACGDGGFYGTAYSVLCWVSDESGIDVRPSDCSDCKCIDYEGGCSKCASDPRGGDALALLIPIGLAFAGRRRPGRG